MLAREATKKDIQAMKDRVKAIQDQKRLDRDIDKVINMVNDKYRRTHNDNKRLSESCIKNRTKGA